MNLDSFHKLNESRKFYKWNEMNLDSFHKLMNLERFINEMNIESFYI
jgi:hypothetical protein